MKLEDAWVVRHINSDTWWRANRNGYTSELIAAGVYTKEEAESCATTRYSRVRTDGSKVWEDKAMPLTEALQGLGEGTVGDLLGLRGAE